MIARYELWLGPSCTAYPEGQEALEVDQLLLPPANPSGCKKTHSWCFVVTAAEWGVPGQFLSF